MSDSINVIPNDGALPIEEGKSIILTKLKRIGDNMRFNRAEPMEVLLYQTYLTYIAYYYIEEVDDVISPNEDSEQFLFARAAVESIEKKYACDDENEIEAFGNNKDIFSSLTSVFRHPKYQPNIYLDAFHKLLDEEYWILMGHHTDENEVFIERVPQDYLEQAHGYLSFISPILNRIGKKVLDFNIVSLPPVFSFDGIEKYVFCPHNDAILRAFLIIRKELESESWHNVEIISELHDLSDPEEKFDYVISDGFLVERRGNTEAVINHLKEDGILLMRIFRPRMNPWRSNDLIRTHMIDTVVALEEVDDQDSISDTERTFSVSIFILKSNRPVDAPVTFINLGKANDFLGKYTLYTVAKLCPERVVTVSQDDIIPTILTPGFYINLRDTRKDGCIPLKSFLASSNTVERVKNSGKNLIKHINTDTRLLETQSSTFYQAEFQAYCTSNSAILIKKNAHHKLDVGFIYQHSDEQFFIDSHISVLPVDNQKVNIRYLTLRIRELTQSIVPDKYMASNQLLELYIQDLSIADQEIYVNRYLNELKNEFNSKLDVKDTSLQLIVFSPNKDSFEVINKEKMDKLGFRVLGYVEDKRSFKEALSEHCGKEVLSSQMADAVLVCADMTEDIIAKVLYFVKNIGTRVFFYSDSPSFDFSKIDEDLVEDFRNGFIQGRDYLERIREKIDADSNKVRDKYPKFFKAADRLDEDYGWGLTEFATGLLQEKPFKLTATELRKKIDGTVISFFKKHHLVPEWLDDGAVPSLIADGKYHDKNPNVDISLTEIFDDKTAKSEAWIKYALVALRKLGNVGSHEDLVSDSSLELASFTIFTEIIIWLDSVRDRYKDRKCLFSVRKTNGPELKPSTVEVYEVNGREYLVADGKHLGGKSNLPKAGDQVIILDTETEKWQQTVNGARVKEFARRENYLIAIKA